MKYNGLSSKEANLLLEKYGKNELKKYKELNPILIFLNQFKSGLIIILIASALVLALINYFSGSKNFIDVILILVIVFISGISSFVQEYKAEKSIEALQKMLVPHAKVIRDGKIVSLSSAEIVPGDFIFIESGDVIPADAELIESNHLEVNESILTGESMPVFKKVGNEIYMNCHISSGNSIARVTNTGMNTRMGNISRELDKMTEDKTQFAIQMDDLSKKLSWIILVVIILATIINLIKYDFINSILIAIALAIAAVPEGLSAVLTLSLATSSRIILQKNALVRRLSTIGDLGSVNFICTDKTGTITQSKMSVVRVYSNREINLAEDINEKDNKELLLCNLLNNNTIEVLEDKLTLRGDETEIALETFGKNLGLDKNLLKNLYPRIHEIPFDSQRKMMTVLVKNNLEKVVYTKGAPENVLRKCSKILVRGKIINLREHEREEIIKTHELLATKGLRVMAFAYRPLKRGETNYEGLENNLVFLGLEGLIDPINPGVKEAISECKTAGITVIMLTGDNPLTAQAISKDAGIDTKGVLTTKDLANLNDKEIYKKILGGYRVFARLTPEEKLRIMTLLKDNGNIVAMTGDGVNDALALKKADVGISMGIRGTDVAKEASDLVLLDDNFATIISAIREGRRVFNNVRKFTNYLLSSNISEVAVFFIATIFLTLKSPILLPIHLLWINLITDGFPALALGVDPAKKDIMKEKPRKKEEMIFNKRVYWTLVSMSILMTFILLGAYLTTLYVTSDEKIATTVLFTSFVLYEFLRIAIIRKEENLSWLSNRFLLVSLISSMIFQGIIIYTPLSKLFNIHPMGIGEWIILLSWAFVGYIVSMILTRIISRRFP